jgi:phosphosulfolactate synthase
MGASLDFLNVPQRPAKPRESGLTLVRDQGHSVAQLEDMLPACGPFVDYAKIKQFELFYMDAELTRTKVRLYREHAVKTFCGGTVVEAALIRNKVKETLAKLKEIGFVAIELSDNIVDLTLERKVNLVGEAVDVGFEVLFEYGKKYDEAPIDVAEATDEIQTLIGAGATRIILERSQLDATLGPDGKLPTAGRLRELADAVGRHRLIFEAETPAHIMWLLHEFGADANLGPNLDMSYVVAGLEPARCGLGRAEGYSFFEKLRT